MFAFTISLGTGIDPIIDYLTGRLPWEGELRVRDGADGRLLLLHELSSWGPSWKILPDLDGGGMRDLAAMSDGRVELFWGEDFYP